MVRDSTCGRREISRDEVKASLAGHFHCDWRAWTVQCNFGHCGLWNFPDQLLEERIPVAKELCLELTRPMVMKMVD